MYIMTQEIIRSSWTLVEEPLIKQTFIDKTNFMTWKHPIQNPSLEKWREQNVGDLLEDQNNPIQNYAETSELEHVLL